MMSRLVLIIVSMHQKAIDKLTTNVEETKTLLQTIVTNTRSKLSVSFVVVII
jgi:hypothetical protein